MNETMIKVTVTVVFVIVSCLLTINLFTSHLIDIVNDLLSKYNHYKQINMSIHDA